MKRALAIGAAAAMLAFGAAPAAQAGEITGGKDPKPTPIKVGTKNGPVPASHCAFSGLDDVDEDEDPNDPATDDFGRTQSFGQIARWAKGDLGGFNASYGCKKGAEFEE
jgi:hypothetical protein